MIMWPFMLAACCIVWICGAAVGQYMAQPDAPRDNQRELGYAMSSVVAVVVTVALAIWVV